MKSKANLNNQIQTYRIRGIPDWSCWQSQIIAGGDACSAIFSGWESFTRQISHMEPGSVSAECLFVFNPKCKGRDMQSRLQLYLRVQTFNESTARAMSMLIERGQISRFYKLEKIDEPLDLPSMSAICDIIRRQDLFEPQHSCELNPRIPHRYRKIHQFTANEENDFRTLDSVLDKVDETVVISVCIAPADISSEMHAITSLMERYYSINHGKAFDDQGYPGMDYTGDDDYKHLSHLCKVEPLKRKDLIADDALHCLKPIHESMCDQPHLSHSIRITAETEATARGIGGVFAEAAFKKGKYRLIVSKKGQTLFDETSKSDGQSDITPVPVYRYLPYEKDGQDYKQLNRLVQLATVDELKGAFRLPVASASSPVLCLRKSTDPVYEDPKGRIVFGFDEQGIEGNSNPISVSASCDELCKHVGIFAASGSGKTTMIIDLMLQLHEMGIPFIVFETSKTELRVIKKFTRHKNPRLSKLAKDLHVFTLGNEKCLPLRFNPLAVPPGIDLKAHIARQKELFSAFMPTFAALPGILSEAMELCYENYPDPDRPPVISDLYTASLKVLSEKSYSDEVSSNIRGALDVRLHELTRLIVGDVFKCRKSIPSIPYLMSSNSVVEMDRLPQEQKCQGTLSILDSILEHAQSLPAADGLRGVVILEEAHNVFRHTGEARPSEEAPDPMAYVAARLEQALVECRARGIAIVVVDQHPSKLHPSAIMGTGIKIAGREIHGDDRDVLAVSMLLPEFQAEDLARLKPGEVYFFKEGFYRPIRIKMENLHEQLDLKNFPTDEELLEIIKNEKWFQEMAVVRINTEMDQLTEHMNRFEAKRVTIMKRTIELQKCYKYIRARPGCQQNKKRLVAVINDARKLHTALRSSYKAFKRGPFKMYSPDLENLNVNDDGIKARAADLSNRFESVVKTGTESVLDRIEKLIHNCKTLMRKEG